MSTFVTHDDNNVPALPLSPNQIEWDATLKIHSKTPLPRRQIPSGLIPKDLVYVSGQQLLQKEQEKTYVMGRIDPITCEMTSIPDPLKPPKPKQVTKSSSNLVSRIYAFVCNLFTQFCNSCKQVWQSGLHIPVFPFKNNNFSGSVHGTGLSIPS